jgi:hypothetical protein
VGGSRTLGLSAAAIVLGVLAEVGAPAAWADGVISPTTTSDAGDPTDYAGCLTDPLPGHSCSLRQAVGSAAANNYSTVAVPAGTYSLSQGELNLQSGISITGAGAGSTVIEQATNGARVISTKSSAPHTISGVTITGGSVSGSQPPSAGAGTKGTDALAVAGGGILNFGPLTVRGVVVKDNTVTGGKGGTGGVSNGTTSGAGGKGGSAFGGGIYTTGALVLDGVVMEGNAVTGGVGGAGGNTADDTAPPGDGGLGGSAFGGHVSVAPGASLSVTGGSFTGALALGGFGGSVGNSHFGSTKIGASVRGGNASGGSIEAEGPVTISDATISGNFAVGGTGGTPIPQSPRGRAGPGGFANGSAITATELATVRRSTISGNQTIAGVGGVGEATAAGKNNGGGDGTGVVVAVGGLDASNVTIAGNSVKGGKGGGASTAQAAGVGGSADGGGLYVGPASVMKLSSSTVAANGAFPGENGSPSTTPPDPSKALAGNIENPGGQLQVKNSIIAAGVAVSFANNCSGSLMGSGHNIEDDADGQCDLDLKGVDPMLDALADNGGPTKTMALKAGSPAIDAAGAGGCVETVDQRGLPRPGIAGGLCDLGAFEVQPPPPPADGGTTPGGGTAPPPGGGDPPVVIPPPMPVAPRLAALKLKPSRFRAKARGVKKPGTTISYTLSAAGSVKFTVQRKLGRKFRAVPGGFARKSTSGANKLRFLGVLKGKRLPAGSYRLVAVPSAAGLKGATKRASFRVLAAPRR